jgi:hypothetical protein
MHLVQHHVTARPNLSIGQRPAIWRSLLDSDADVRPLQEAVPP